MSITPTTGRVILFIPNSELGLNCEETPCAAIVAGVNSDGTINLAAFDHKGNHFAAQDVPIVEMEVGKEVPAHGHFAYWMPYQLKVAADATTNKVPAPAPAEVAKTTDTAKP